MWRFLHSTQRTRSSPPARHIPHIYSCRRALSWHLHTHDLSIPLASVQCQPNLTYIQRRYLTPTVRDPLLSSAAGARLFAFPLFPTAGRCCTSLPPFPLTTFLLDGATTMLPACWGWVDVSAKRRRRGHGGDGSDGEMW